MALVLFTAPAAEPLVRDTDVKPHLRIDFADDDAYLDAMIVAARQWVENYLRRGLINQTWDYYLDAFPSAGQRLLWTGDERYRFLQSLGSGTYIEIPKPPLQSIVSVSYTDSNGVTQALNATDYQVDSQSEPGRIFPAFGTYWPVARYVPNAVKIRFTCGFGSAGSSVPQAIKLAMLMMIAHWYEHRESVTDLPSLLEVPMSVTWLLAVHRINTFR